MFWKTIDWIVEKLKIIGAACLVGMTFLTCADVVGRLFLHPYFWFSGNCSLHGNLIGGYGIAIRT